MSAVTFWLAVVAGLCWVAWIVWVAWVIRKYRPEDDGTLPP